MRSAVVGFLLLLAACGGASAPQGAGLQYGEVGNGGHGIRQAGRIFLYDLWESGLHDREKIGVPTSDMARSLEAFFSSDLAHTFPHDPAFVTLLSKKLVDIHEMDPILTLTLVETIQAYGWAFTDARLRPLRLPDPVHDVAEGDIVLLANRSGRFIYLYRQAWNQMDQWNRVALVLHEAIYSLLPPLVVRVSDVLTELRQDGKRARQFVALLFGAVPKSRLSNGQLALYVDPGELPTTAPGLNPFRITSTWFVRDPRYRIAVPAGRIGLVGTASYNVYGKEADHRANVPIYAVSVPGIDDGVPASLKDFCERLVKGPDEPYRHGLEFESPISLRFAQYDAKGEIKYYVRHERLTGPVGQTTSQSDARHFFDIARGPDIFGPPPTHVRVREACQRYIGGVATRRNFFYPSVFPLDPRRRYGD